MKEYNDMLEKLLRLHKDPNHLYIRFKLEDRLTQIQKNAINDFIQSLRDQQWMIEVAEEIDRIDETHVTWPEEHYYLMIHGKSQNKEYDDMLQRLKSLHTDPHRLSIRFKLDHALTSMEKSAIRDFIKQLPNWMIEVDEHVIYIEETHVTWPEEIYFLVMTGKLLSSKL